MKAAIYNILFGLLFWGYGVPCWANTDSLLLVLDQTIAEQEIFVQQKNNRIIHLKEQLRGNVKRSLNSQFNIYNQLFLEYQSYVYDSAFAIAIQQFQTANSLKDQVKMTQSKLNLAFVLRSSGRYRELFDTLNTIQSNGLPDSLLLEYYEQMSRSNFDLAIYNRDSYFNTVNNQLGKAYADSALSLCEPNSLAYFRIGGLKAEANNNYREATFMYHSIIENFNVDLHQYAMASFSLGNISKALGQKEESLNLIIEAATADLKASVKEGVALMDLAQYYYHQGDIDRAYRYIIQAAYDANLYGARHRTLQVYAILPAIENAKLVNVEYQSKKRLLMLIGLGLLLILILVFSLVIYRQYIQLKQTKHNLQLLNEKLLEANVIKEEYIGHSFTKDAEYLHKLDKFKKDIEKKLDERKFDDLRYIIRMFNLKREQEALFVKFDEIFLKLFPDFIPYFNSFFNTYDQYKVKEKQSLPVEMRIYALIRIGISDHEQIASILGYSVQTIYNYKAKLKGKSIFSKEDFEEKLMEIKTF